MMTEVANPSRRIAASQVRLAERYPFFAALLMMAPVVITDSVLTAATDGRQLLFNPEFIEQLSADELDGLIVHELLHCALLHIPRRGEREPLLWNIAADIHINGMIREMPLLQLPAGTINEPRLAHLCVEEIYIHIAKSKAVRSLGLTDLMPGDSNSDAGASGGGSSEGGVGTGAAGAGVDGASAAEDLGAEALGAFWADAMHRAMAIAAMTGRGTIPASIVRAVRETHSPQLDWRTSLWRHMVRTPDDFSGFDRRHVWQGLYVDALENESLDVDVCIDTSGSIDNVQLSLFLAELRGIVGAYPSVRCRLYYADAACHGPFEVDANADFSVAKGGGGTDFQPFFEQTAPTQFTNHAGHDEPRLAIYLTDGEGIFPSEAPDRPVLWVVTPGGADSAKFPFGTVVRMRE